MDKKRINKNKRLTIREFGLVGDRGSVDVGGRHFLFKEKFIEKVLGDVDEFGDSKSVELTDGERKGQDPWSFYTFGGSAPGAPIFDLSEICGGVFCGFSGGHCTQGVYMGQGNCQDWWHLRI